MRVFGNLSNRIMEGSNGKLPVIGEGATILMFSDRYAATVVGLSKRGEGFAVTIQEDKYTRTDKNGMSDAQEYSYEPNPHGLTHVVTLRKDGRWIYKGESMKNGTAVRFGVRDHHYDFGF